MFLPSGGHLVIDRTEAMTVVDVNTGKYTGAGGNLEETVTRNNLEAAEEIVRQLRLRDLGGIVVIDFIDMVLESNRELVLRRLTECLGRDRTKHQVTEITSLGLVQMTRKRIGAGLLEAFSETCEYCKGRGLIIHTEPVPEKRARGAREPGQGGRRGGRTGAGAEQGAKRTSPRAPAANAPAAARRARGRRRRARRPVVEDSDTMGYDLSPVRGRGRRRRRCRGRSPTWPRSVGRRRRAAAADLAGADDPDAATSDDDRGRAPVGAGAAGVARVGAPAPERDRPR